MLDGSIVMLIGTFSLAILMGTYIHIKNTSKKYSKKYSSRY